MAHHFPSWHTMKTFGLAGVVCIASVKRTIIYWYDIFSIRSTLPDIFLCECHFPISHIFSKIVFFTSRFYIQRNKVRHDFPNFFRSVLNGELVSCCDNTHGTDRKKRIERKAAFVFGLEGFVFGHEVVLGCFGRKLFVIDVFDAVGAQERIFFFSQAVKVGVEDFGQFAFALLPRFDKQIDAHALFDVEDVLVLTAVGCGLFFVGVAVEVEDVDFVESLQQFVAHSSECRVVQITVGIDVGQYPFAVALDIVLAVADEFDVIVVEPLGIFLFEFAAVWLLLVIVQELLYPRAFVGRMPRIGRITQHHHDGGVAFDAVGFIGLFGQP